MKATFWVFAIAVFVISLAQPAYACGGNTGRYARTTPTATTTTSSTAPSPTAGGAQPAGTLRD